ncbi:MAG TPA: hypothetical protein VLF15_06175 [Pseudoxanthomonas sp.]|nr:hypothetical protein [Pseudoxanthomonas sp.]
MIEEIQFSDRGDAPTAFEVRLLQADLPTTDWTCAVRRLVMDFGPDIAAKVLVSLMDELGGEKIHIPPRRKFFESLWRDERDALIVSLSSRPDWPLKDIASVLGVSNDVVRQVLLRGRRRTTEHR